jgi:hypothetical protein
MYISVIFHNLSEYDKYIIMQEIGVIKYDNEIRSISYNIKKYIAFKLGSFAL